jgi:hypothetical protein
VINRDRPNIGINGEGGVGDRARPNQALPDREVSTKQARGLPPGTGPRLARGRLGVLDDRIELSWYVTHFYGV